MKPARITITFLFVLILSSTSAFAGYTFTASWFCGGDCHGACGYYESSLSNIAIGPWPTLSECNYYRNYVDNLDQSVYGCSFGYNCSACYSSGGGSTGGTTGDITGSGGLTGASPTSVNLDSITDGSAFFTSSASSEFSDWVKESQQRWQSFLGRNKQRELARQKVKMDALNAEAERKAKEVPIPEPVLAGINAKGTEKEMLVAYHDHTLDFIDKPPPLMGGSPMTAREREIQKMKDKGIDVTYDHSVGEWYHSDPEFSDDGRLGELAKIPADELKGEGKGILYDNVPGGKTMSKIDKAKGLKDKLVEKVVKPFGEFFGSIDPTTEAGQWDAIEKSDRFQKKMERFAGETKRDTIVGEVTNNTGTAGKIFGWGYNASKAYGD